jgi:hypothetical protein
LGKDLKGARVSQAHIWKDVPGRGNSKCKGPGAGSHLKCLRSSNGVSVTEVEVLIGERSEVMRTRSLRV